ncbi:hypothetical protein [Leifsonia poae]|uniref:hypothetical protein n=1 Tax=Leifsonia poae TaxID=110933 RepID=UPI001CBAC289|nr:hypothetical protein [Leifsonia poae]
MSKERSRQGRFSMPIVALLGIGMALLSAPTAVYADESPLMLSSDGRSWAPTLSSAIFDEGHRFIPGDVEPASFWVKNTAKSTMWLTVQVVKDPDTARHLDVDFGLGTVELNSGCTTIVENQPLQRGVPVRFAGSISANSNTSIDTRNRGSGLRIKTLLADSPTALAAGDCIATGEAVSNAHASQLGELSATGLNASTLAIAGAAALVLGALLAGMRRLGFMKKRRKGSDVQSA